jgi:hypothetical protein
MIIKDEESLVKCMEPVMEVAVEAIKRVEALEANTSRAAGDDACDSIVKMTDSFLRGEPVSVLELPHIKQAAMVCRAFGRDLSIAMPEVQS